MNDITKEQTKPHRLWADPAKFGDEITAADIAASVQVQLRSLILGLMRGETMSCF